MIHRSASLRKCQRLQLPRRSRLERNGKLYWSPAERRQPADPVQEASPPRGREKPGGKAPTAMNELIYSPVPPRVGPVAKTRPERTDRLAAWGDGDQKKQRETPARSGSTRLQTVAPCSQPPERPPGSA
ncbi:unnamed protein product [Natator depressus]